MTWIQNFDHAITCSHDDVESDGYDSRCKICGTWSKGMWSIETLREIFAENPNEVIDPKQFKNDDEDYTIEMVEKIRSLFK